ncbi:hypothetical protein B0H19DRAFT_553221 [Mycena capillaripes]|nr:hypothetical protein B0H19DRAFT_553221 [Mycena capillaripes]
MLVLRLSRTLWVPKHGGGRRLFSDAPFSIPHKPKGWPTPWITETEATEYLFPLYSQGWYVAAVSGDQRTVRTAGLACRFAFPSCTPAGAFIKDVLTLTETENHHPHWLRLSNSADEASVHICSTTHSALRPEWDSAIDTHENRALAGITLRDLRFAALISSLPSNTYRPSAEIGPSRTRPTWDDLCANLRFWSTPPSPSTEEPPERVDSKNKSPVCAACAGPHRTSACRTRHTLTPPPCSICHGLHWRVDCPVSHLSQRSHQTKVSQIKKTPKTTPNHLWTVAFRRLRRRC